MKKKIKKQIKKSKVKKQIKKKIIKPVNQNKSSLSTLFGNQGTQKDEFDKMIEDTNKSFGFTKQS